MFHHQCWYKFLVMIDWFIFFTCSYYIFLLVVLFVISYFLVAFSVYFVSFIIIIIIIVVVLFFRFRWPCSPHPAPYIFRAPLPHPELHRNSRIKLHNLSFLRCCLIDYLMASNYNLLLISKRLREKRKMERYCRCHFTLEYAVYVT